MKELIQETENDKCVSCNSILIDDGQYIVCTTCGLVHCETNIKTNDYGKFEEVKTLMTLGTCVGSPKTRWLYDKMGNVITSNKGSFYGRLRKWDRHYYFQDDYVFNIAYIIADKICSYLQLNKMMQNKIMHLYRKLLSKNLEKVKNRVTLLATCFYIILKEESMPITMGQLSSAFKNHGHRVNERLIFQVVLDLKIRIKRHGNPRDYIEKFLSQINLYLADRFKTKQLEMNQDEYMNLLRKTVYKVLESKIYKNKIYQPDKLSAAMIYFAVRLIDKKHGGHYTLTQGIISKATGIPSYSLRDIYVKTFRKFIERDE